MSEEKLIQHKSQEQTSEKPEEPINPVQQVSPENQKLCKEDVFDEKYQKMKDRLMLKRPENHHVSGKPPSPRGSVAGFDNAFAGKE